MTFLIGILLYGTMHQYCFLPFGFWQKVQP